MQNSDKTDESFYQTVQIWSGMELSGVYDFEFDKSEINHSNWIIIRMFQDSSNESKRMKRYRTESTYSTTATLADFDISTRCKTVLKLTMHFRCICNTFQTSKNLRQSLIDKQFNNCVLGGFQKFI